MRHSKNDIGPKAVASNAKSSRIVSFLPVGITGCMGFTRYQIGAAFNSDVMTRAPERKMESRYSHAGRHPRKHRDYTA